MSVHYKFKSGKDTHTITFDCLHISVGELKKSIMQQRKMGKSADLDLQITNAQTKEIYESDAMLIPKNTFVTVARVPVANSKKSWNKSDNNKSNDNSYPTEEKTLKNNNASVGTEDDKIKEMLNLSTKDYDPSKYARGKGPMGPLPPNYTCYRCGKPGHYIKHCPTNNIDVKRSTGIPRSFMIPAKADQKGAMITASGEYAVPIIDHDAYREVKKEKPPFFSTEIEPELPKVEIPDDLKCSLCTNLLQDAVLIPCCGNSFCDECIRSLLLDSDNHECPSCKETDVSPDTLIPNRFLRLSVAKFKNEISAAVAAAAASAASEAQPVTEETNAPKSEFITEEIVDEKPKSPVPDEKANDKSDQDLNKVEPKEEPNDDKDQADKEDGDQADVTDGDLCSVAKNESSPVDEEKPKLGPEENDFDDVGSNENKNELTRSPANEKISSSGMTPSLTPINALQPPFALSLNNNGVGRYRQNQIRVRSSGQPNVFAGRVPGQLMMPRNNFSQNRTLLPNDAPFFNDPMHQFAQMGMPIPFGHFGSQIRGPMFDNMYNMNSRGGPMNTMMSFGNNVNMGLLGGPPLLDADGQYHHPSFKYDDYEDKLERFNRQLESRSRLQGRRYSRERSPSRSGRSRSRSYSTDSSRSSSRSRRSPRPRRRSPNRYGRDRRERSRSSHRLARQPQQHRGTSGRHHPDSKSDKRMERPRERNGRDQEREREMERDRERERRQRLNRPPREREYGGQSRDANQSHFGADRIPARRSEEKKVVDSWHKEGDEERSRPEKNEAIRPSSNTNATLEHSPNKDSNPDKVAAQEEETIVNVPVNGSEHTAQATEETVKAEAEEERKPAVDEPPKVESHTDFPDKPKDRPTGSKRNRSRTRSPSSSSDSNSDLDTLRSSKKRSKKSSKESSKSKGADRRKSRQENKTKEPSKSASSKSNKSLHRESKEASKLGEEKSCRKTSRDESKSRRKSESTVERKATDSMGADMLPGDNQLQPARAHDDDDHEHGTLWADRMEQPAPKEGGTDLDKHLEQVQLARKSDEMEIKIQEDYSDLENEEVARSRRDSAALESKASQHNNLENVGKSLQGSPLKPEAPPEKTEKEVDKEGTDKDGEDSHRKVKISTSKLTEKPLLSVTIENKAKNGSKISSSKNKEAQREKDRERDKRRDKEPKSDRTKERKESNDGRDGRGKSSKDGGGKGKDSSRHRDRSSHREQGKSESGSSKSKSKDKKRDKERGKEREKDRQKDDRSKRSRRRSRSRSSSLSAARKKIKSEIDTSASSSKHKSSKSHRK